MRGRLRFWRPGVGDASLSAEFTRDLAANDAARKDLRGNVTIPIREVARDRPEAVALIRADDAAVSYRTLDRLIDRVARRVLRLGFSPGDTVGLAVSGPDEALALVLALALARIGVASAELDVPAQYLAAVFVQPGANRPPEMRCITIDESWLANDVVDEAAADAVPMPVHDPVPVHDNDAAIFRVISTSGTTGRSRCCPISHAVMNARVATTGFPVVGTRWPTILICALGLGGAWGMRTALKVLSVGGTLVFTNQARLLDAVRRHGVTSLTISTNTLQAVLAAIPPGAGPLPGLRAVLTGGSQVPAPLTRMATERLCANMMICYGATEVGTVAIGRQDALAAVPFGVGIPEPGVEAQAVDARHRPLPAGTEGVLRFRTRGAITGYLDDSVATRETFRDGWFYPGDLGKVTRTGVLVVTGRADGLINRGGVKVSPHLIEEVLLSLPEVAEAAAIGVPDADGVPQIWAFIVADGRVELAVLKRLCREKLGQRAPKFIVQVKQLPRNANGKVQTASLVRFATEQGRLDPANQADWQEQGVALLRGGRLPEAIDAFRRVIAAMPDSAPAHHMLGQALEAQGNETVAVEALRRAVALSPDLVDAHARLGTLLLSLSQRKEAVAAFRLAASLDPDAEIGRLALANALMAEGRQDEAEAVLRHMVERYRGSFDGHKMLGDLLSFGGRFEEAGREYQCAIDTGRQPANAYHSLVMSRKLTDADRPLVEAMRRQLNSGRQRDFALMILHFALGKALDDLDDPEAAMAHFDAANRLRHRTAKLGRARLTEQFDAFIERFTPEYFARHAALGSDDETPVMVLGMPRSGTTLTEQIISSHPAVAGGGELPYWGEAGPAWDAGVARGPITAHAQRVAADYLLVLRDIGPHAARVTDKMPPNFVWTGLIHLVFPKARIIHCKRDPVDTCLSIYSTYFTARMDFSADRGDLVFFYRQYERLMRHWRDVLPPEVYFETQYEELVADHETRSRELIAFCGLDWDDACLRPERNERQVRTASLWQARQPVYKTPVARWRRYENWLGELRDLMPG
jgi:acyl-coenzyme A synthetase/AMP-(fatty) acid ligase